MDPTIVGVGIAALAATVMATAAILAPWQAVQTWVRRLSLIVFNLSPWTIGTWRRSFTKRETFLAAWFLVFILTLVLLATLFRRSAP
jgi:hypothetical protein